MHERSADASGRKLTGGFQTWRVEKLPIRRRPKIAALCHLSYDLKAAVQFGYNTLNCEMCALAVITLSRQI